MDESPSTHSGSSSEEKSFFQVIVHSFFIVPFLIVVFSILLFGAVKLLTHEPHSVYDFLEDIQTGGAAKRWQAAFELSKTLANPALIPRDERFDRELIRAFEKSRHDDVRVRQYLALAMGRTQKSVFFEPLTAGIGKEPEENLPAVIYGLGMLGDPRAVKVLSPYLQSPDARIRSLAVAALGNIAESAVVPSLTAALDDAEPNVQWGAAIALAKMGDSAGLEILAKLLDRGYLAQFQEVDSLEQNDLMLAAIEAASILREERLTEQILEISQTDPNMKVRNSAMKYLKIPEQP